MNLILWWVLLFLILILFRNKIKNTIYFYIFFLALFYIKIFFYFDLSWKDANEIWVEWLNLLVLVMVWLLINFIFFILDLYNNKEFLPKNEEYLRLNKYLIILILLIVFYLILNVILY